MVFFIFVAPLVHIPLSTCFFSSPQSSIHGQSSVKIVIFFLQGPPRQRIDRARRALSSAAVARCMTVVFKGRVAYVGSGFRAPSSKRFFCVRVESISVLLAEGSSPCSDWALIGDVISLSNYLERDAPFVSSMPYFLLLRVLSTLCYAHGSTDCSFRQ